MVDFIKVEILEPYRSEMIDKLSFGQLIECDQNSVLKSEKRIVKHKDLTVVVHESDRTVLKGSIHKFSQNGMNYRDFTLDQVKRTLKEVSNWISVPMSAMRILDLEIGVNIALPYSSSRVVANVLYHKTTPSTLYESNKRRGRPIESKEFSHQLYTFKVYDKSKQYSTMPDCPTDLLRIETRYTGHYMRTVFKISTMQDLVDHLSNNTVLPKLIVNSIYNWNQCIFFDWEALKIKSLEKYSSLDYWSTLKTENFKYHRKRIGVLIENSKQSVFRDIEGLIEYKYKSLLNTPPTRISSLGKPLIQVGTTPQPVPTTITL